MSHLVGNPEDQFSHGTAQNEQTGNVLFLLQIKINPKFCSNFFKPFSVTEKRISVRPGQNAGGIHICSHDMAHTI